jgi:hypothetical protein
MLNDVKIELTLHIPNDSEMDRYLRDHVAGVVEAAITMIEESVNEVSHVAAIAPKLWYDSYITEINKR